MTHSLSPCSTQRPLNCTHLVFKDDLDEYQQQLRKEDHQKDPEELKREREGLTLLQAKLCRLPGVNGHERDLETKSCFETLRNQIIFMSSPGSCKSLPKILVLTGKAVCSLVETVAERKEGWID